MSLAPSTDSVLLNRVLNHPEVARWMIGFEPPYDLTPFVEDPANIFLANEHGGFLFVREQAPAGHPAIYEVHTQFLPEGRGSSRRLALDAVSYMFTQTDCDAIHTYVPHENEAARRLTVSVGFDELCECEVNGYPCTIYTLNREAWLCQQQRS